MRLAWCDMLALVWAAILILFICALQNAGGFAHSLQPENIWGGWGELMLKLVFYPWLVLRAIDLLCGGVAYRRGRITARWVR